MISLIINWLIILIAGALLGKYLKPLKSFYSGLISLVIAVVITYLVHLIIISNSNLIWAIIAVSYASFFSGFFASKTAFKEKRE